MKWTALFSMLAGCGGSKPQPPRAPGTSIKLAYPVLLAGGESPTIRVEDDEVSLTTTRAASGAVYMNLKLIDSAGTLYEVVRESQPEGRPSSWRDMGTSNYRVHLELKRVKTVNVDQGREMVLDVIRAPRSLWSLYPEGTRVAAERVGAFRTVPELIEGCRRASEWTR
jgi:hypothetical protein